MKPRSIAIATEDSHPVIADLYLPERPRGTCILCHGFKSYRSWGFFPYLARGLADAGMASVVIDFSHNGTVPEDGSIVEVDPDYPYIAPKLFAANTLGREISDLDCTVRALLHDGLRGMLDPAAPLALLGHSRGGACAMLVGSGYDRVRAIAAWSVPVHPDVFTEEQKRRWREQGRLEFTDNLTGTALAVERAYLEDLEKNYSSYDLRAAAKKTGKACIFVHGTADAAIPAESSVRLYEAMGRKARRKLLLLRTGHTFGVGPRFVEEGFAVKKALDETVAWFLSTLSRRCES